MPHGLFLGSALATQGRALESELFEPDDFEADMHDSPTPSGILGLLYSRFWLPVRYMFKIDRRARGPNCAQGHAGWPNNTLEFVRAHLWHGIIDVMGSLLGFAVIINAVYAFSLYSPQTIH